MQLSKHNNSLRNFQQRLIRINKILTESNKLKKIKDSLDKSLVLKKLEELNLVTAGKSSGQASQICSSSMSNQSYFSNLSTRSKDILLDLNKNKSNLHTFNSSLIMWKELVLRCDIANYINYESGSIYIIKNLPLDNGIMNTETKYEETESNDLNKQNKNNENEKNGKDTKVSKGDNDSKQFTDDAKKFKKSSLKVSMLHQPNHANSSVNVNTNISNDNSKVSMQNGQNNNINNKDNNNTNCIKLKKSVVFGEDKIVLVSKSKLRREISNTDDDSDNEKLRILKMKIV